MPETVNDEDNTLIPDAGKVNILVVDDLPDKIYVYKTILDDLGQNLMTARSGEEALKLVLKHEFAVILLDVNMPGMNGFETAELIRQRRKSAHTPIIFLTAFNDEMQVAQGYASGAVDYLPTPVVPEILKAKVRVFIELSQMRQLAARQAEESARRAAAEEADRRKDEFLGMLAHELRNPLGPISNAVHLLQLLTPGSDPRLAQLRDIIDRQVRHMTRLIDDLLDSTRLARGQILLRREPCDLAKIIEQTVEDYRSIYESAGLTLRTDLPKTPLWADGDPTRLVQAVGNLLHNAHKFTDAGGTVTVSLKEDRGGQAAIIVTDTGMGIDPDILPHIFDVFRQGEQGLDRNRGGLGLGLSLVRGLVELHGGTVRAASAGPGKGASFTIRLPARPALAAAAPQDAAPAAPEGHRRRVLIIEDNPDTAESTRQLLEMDGYTVEVAGNGPAGLEAARGFGPEIVLCDIGLPGMDGYEVARSLRRDPALSSATIIAMTGYGREEDLRRAREAGFDLHLVKPVDFNSLRRALAGLRQAA